MIQPAERLTLDTPDDLYLSLVTADDAVDIRTYMNDNPSVMRNAPEGMQVSEYRAGRIVEQNLYDIQIGLKAPYLLRQPDEAVIGYMELEQRDVYAAASYSVAEAVRGRGLAGLALSRLIQQGQEQRGLQRVGFWIEAVNIASQSVAHKLGATHHKTVNDGELTGEDVTLQYWEKAL
jgi:RimJ/RimL family protein N-acetyltransferase